MNLHLNHLYLVLPDRVYRTILTSDFLQTAFPGVERRVTQTVAGERWSGAYFYTRENYIELFPASAGFWQEEAADGWGGLAFSVDEPGGMGAAAAAIESKFGYAPFRTLRELQVGADTVDWFHYVRIAESLNLPSFDSWIMEYTPAIFQFKGLPVPESGLLTREAYLSQWNQPRPKKIGQGLPAFRRISEITLRMGQEYAEKYAAVLTYFGYAQSREGDTLLLRHPQDEITLRFLPEEPTEHKYRIRSITLELARPILPVLFVFAPGSQLEIKENGTAEWRFGEG